MARPFAVAFYHSKEWKRTRQEYMDIPVETKAGICPPGMCEMCFERGKLVPAEIVHHIEFLSPENINEPSVRSGFCNLMRVCRDCHAEIHYNDDCSSRVYFDEDGNIVKR